MSCIFMKKKQKTDPAFSNAASIQNKSTQDAGKKNASPTETRSIEKNSSDCLSNYKQEDSKFLNMEKFLEQAVVLNEEKIESPKGYLGYISERKPQARGSSSEIMERKDSNKEFGELQGLKAKVRSALVLNQFTSDFCEEELRVFHFDEDNYKKVELVSETDWGNTWRGYSNLTRKIVLMRIVELSFEDISKDHENILKILEAREVLKTLNMKDTNVFSLFLGAFYLLCPDGKVSALILVSETGDCSLEELISARQSLRMTPKEPVATASLYDKHEAYTLLKSLLKCLLILEELKIYHSNICPSRISYRKGDGLYVIEDFAFSHKVAKESKIVSMYDYAKAGTLPYVSPEKRTFWEMCKEGRHLFSFEDHFNPFKCDLYSVGAVFSELVRVQEGALSGVSKQLLFEDWKKRLGAREIYQMLKLAGKENMLVESQSRERMYADIIEKKRREKPQWEGLFTERSSSISKSIAAFDEDLRRELKLNNGYVAGKELLFAKLINKKAHALSLLGEFRRAADCFEKELELRRSVEYNSVLITRAMHSLAQQYSHLGDYFKAIEILEEVISVRRSFYGTELNEEIATALFTQAQQWSSLGDFEKSAKQLERVLEIERQIYKKPDHPSLISTMRGLAKVWSQLGEYSRSAEELEKIIQLQRGLYKTEIHPELVLTQEALAQQWGKLGEYERAIAELSKVLDIRIKLHETRHHPNVTNTIFALAQQLSLNGDYKKSIEQLNTVIKIDKAVYKQESHPNIGCAYHELAMQYLHLNSYERASEHLEKALGIKMAINNTEANLEIAATLFSQARLWSELAQYPKAAQQYMKVLDIYKRVFKRENTPEVAATMRELAVQWSVQGEFTRAGQMFRRALEIQEGLFKEKKHLSQAKTLFEIARHLSRQGNYQAAIDNLEEALRIRHTYIRSKHHLELASTIHEIGVQQINMSKLEMAKPNVLQALEIRRIKLETSKTTDLAASVAELARLNTLTGETDRAREGLDAALNMLQEVLKTETHDAVAKVYYYMAVLNEKKGEREEARNNIGKSIEILSAIFKAQEHYLIVLAKNFASSL